MLLNVVKTVHSVPYLMGKGELTSFPLVHTSSEAISDHESGCDGPTSENWEIIMWLYFKIS